MHVIESKTKKSHDMDNFIKPFTQVVNVGFDLKVCYIAYYYLCHTSGNTVLCASYYNVIRLWNVSVPPLSEIWSFNPIANGIDKTYISVWWPQIETRCNLHGSGTRQHNRHHSLWTVFPVAAWRPHLHWNRDCAPGSQPPSHTPEACLQWSKAQVC